MGFFLTDALVKRRHDLTLIHRGNTIPDGMPNVRNVVGDREASLDDAGNDYDIVIDTSGMLPRQVRASTQHCINSARYIFISTVSVYRDPLAPHADESAPRCPSGDPNVDSGTMEIWSLKGCL